ncbi:hypothetical protein GCM10011359_23060 [Nesterenkonia alkaliphila]|nr:hypothetical protein GCM10011359_23060 [Nesterenkonia alkaliphila]
MVGRFVEQQQLRGFSQKDGEFEPALLPGAELFHRALVIPRVNEPKGGQRHSGGSLFAQEVIVSLQHRSLRPAVPGVGQLDFLVKHRGTEVLGPMNCALGGLNLAREGREQRGLPSAV